MSEKLPISEWTLGHATARFAATARPILAGASALITAAIAKLASLTKLTIAQAGVLAAAAVIVVLVAVGFTWSHAASTTPESTARQYLKAVQAQDTAKLTDLTCTAVQPQLLAALQDRTFLGMETKLTLSNLTFTTESNTGTSAMVHIQGHMDSALASGLYDAQMPLAFERGKWRECGL